MKNKLTILFDFLLSKSLAIIILLANFFSLNVYAQNCPPNIDFETGTFANWKCYTGNTYTIGNQNEISLTEVNGPINGIHTMYSSANNQTDMFGGFPTACPNGSGYSIKLGNNEGGGLAEGVSYEFTIPLNQNNYSLTYYYAVVFQDPNHQTYQQPRLVIEAQNVSNNEILYCSSFTFFPNGSPLPGFFKSDIEQDTTDVWCKNWSAVTMNLNGQAGKTIKLTFKTGDCTFRKHFGYAYIDVNTECSSEFVGATYCSDDTAVVLNGPYGYQGYRWFNSSFTSFLGNEQVLLLQPPPPSGTTIAVEVTPYNGYGCVDTFYAKLFDTLTIIPNAGLDAISCDGKQVQIGAPGKPNHVYLWSPTQGLTDATLANPRASPPVTTTYTLNVKSIGGGCRVKDSVIVEVSNVDTSLQLIGKNLFCITSKDSAVLIAKPLTSIQWYKDDVMIAGANQPRYRALQTGQYKALLTNDKGCQLFSNPRHVQIDIPEPGIRYSLMNGVRNIPMELNARNIGTEVLWNPGFQLNNVNLYSPTFKGNQDIVYTIKMTTAANCITIDTQQVRLFEYLEIFVPSAFTPNNDGNNDYVAPLAAGFKKLNYFKIYNRWGQQVFDLQQNERGWNGIYKGIPQPVSTYVWMAEGIGVDNKIYQKKGTIVLIR